MEEIKMKFNESVLNKFTDDELWQIADLAEELVFEVGVDGNNFFDNEYSVQSMNDFRNKYLPNTPNFDGTITKIHTALQGGLFNEEDRYVLVIEDEEIASANHIYELFTISEWEEIFNVFFENYLDSPEDEEIVLNLVRKYNDK
jgi:hypothetical protein